MSNKTVWVLKVRPFLIDLADHYYTNDADPWVANPLKAFEYTTLGAARNRRRGWHTGKAAVAIMRRTYR